MQKLKMAIIGCGRISFKHVDAINANHEAIECVALVDIDIKKTQKLFDYFNNKSNEKKLSITAIKIYEDYRTMIFECRPDFISICTESGYHAEIAIHSLNNGCHVICEKPMALSINDADMMIAASKKSNKLLAVAFQNRFNTTVDKARKAYENKRFGKMMHVVASIRWNRDESYYKQAPWRGTWELDGGTLMNQCTHNIDLLQWFCGGEAKEVYGVTAKYMRDIEAEDFGTAIIKFMNGCIGIIEGSVNIYPNNLEETLFLSGTKGTVKLGGLAINKIETWRFEDDDVMKENEAAIIKDSYELGDDFQAVYGFGHALLYKDFHDAIVFNRKPYITGEEGKKALEIILAIYKSQKTGKSIQLPLKNFSTTMMKSNNCEIFPKSMYYRLS